MWLRISLGPPARAARADLAPFEVPTSYVDELRASVPESMARQFPGSPFRVDVNQAPCQFGIRVNLFPDLLANIVPGSGGTGDRPGRAKVSDGWSSPGGTAGGGHHNRAGTRWVGRP